MKRFLLSFVVTLAVGAAIPSLLPAQLSSGALRVLGQADLNRRGFNSVDGSELRSPGGVAIDERDGVVHVYVADTSNNRVLAWRDIRAVENGGRADVALGQRSLEHTTADGIGAGGLDTPTAVTVDPATGDVFVSDTGNNRVLRFIYPFENTDRVEPDKVFGQADFQERRANQPFRGPGSMSSPSTLSFDAMGNLWVADAGNHRLLRFLRSALDADSPEADLVLGQTNFETGQANAGMNQVGPVGFNGPASTAFHPNGSLYVADFNNARILVFEAPFSTGQQAASVLGQTDFMSRAVAPTITASSMRGPNGLHIDSAGNLFVAIGAENRVLVFDDVASSTFGLLDATRVIGQPLLTSDSPNVGTFPTASDSGFFQPVELTGDSNGTLYIADASNNRVAIVANGTAPISKVLGQPDFLRNGANRVGPESVGQVTSLAIDYSTEGFPLYACDSPNNRVLGWSSSLRFENGAPADLVIGQADFVSSVANADTGRAQSPTRTSLAQPRGLAVDAQGNLWVADAGNNRALRFARPFEQSGRVSADTVLGQQGFFSSISASVTASSLQVPFDVAIGVGGEIYVSDAGNSRVLEYPSNPASGAAAVRVFGQTSFTNGAEPTQVSALSLTTPTGLAIDPLNFLLVADAGANRVVIYPLSPDAPTSAVTAGSVIGQPGFDTGAAGVGPARLNGPQNVGVDPDGQIFVADTNNHRVLTFPSLFSLPTAGGEALQALGQRDLNSAAANFNTQDLLATPEGLFEPVGLLVDRQGTVWLGDVGNSRIVHFVRPAVAVNAARFTSGLSVAPGSLVSLFGPNLSDEEQAATAIPLPTELGGSRFEINDEYVAGLLFVSPGQANIQLPSEAPTGLQSLAVRRADTDEVIAGGPIILEPANPGLFTVTQDGTGQALALNQDGSLNSPANPAPRGSVVQLFGTGQGATDPMVATGEPAPSGPLAQTTTASATTQRECVSRGFTCVAISSNLGEVLFSGLAPGFVGLWQVNVRIPSDLPDILTGDTVPIRVGINQRFANAVSIAIR